jgi:NlpC/P60 family protein
LPYKLLLLRRHLNPHTDEGGGGFASAGLFHGVLIRMLPKFQAAVLFLACLVTQFSYAQRNDAESRDVRETGVIQSSAPARLLNLDEGLAVLGAAMETAHHRPLRQDCSHFVHEIYDRAGFPYSYENSVTLYDGTGDFQRVTKPQPGDLIVWRGHMGIMVNPAQHTFFSSLRTGFGVEKYDSRYWHRRGRPRFYRYVKTAATGLTLASAKTSSVNESALHPPEATSTDTSARSVPASASLPVSSATDPLPLEPSVLPVAVSGNRPTREALSQALEERFSDANIPLGNSDLLNSTKPVVIVDNFQVKKVHVKHDQGWVEVQMNEPSSLTGGEANLQRRSEKQRWPLYRNGNEWQVELPTDAIYLPKDAAVRLLAHELAAMTGRRTPPTRGTQQAAQLARLLDRLLGE